MPGRFLTEALDIAPPEGMVATYERGRRENLEHVQSAEADEVTRAKLEALGYVGADQSLQSYINLATYYSSQGRHEEALEEYRRALSKQPSSGRIHMMMAGVYGALGDRKLAQEHLEIAKKLDPELLPARVNLARLYFTSNRVENAKKELADLLEKAPKMGAAWVELGRIQLAEGQPEKAEESFRKAIAVDPDYLEGRIQLGLLLIRSGRFDEAEEHCRAVIRFEPMHRIAWNNLGVIQLKRAARIEDPQRREEALDKALATFNSMVERFPNYPKPYLNRAQIRIARRQFDLGIEDLNKALELDPDYEEAKAWLKQLNRRPPR
jgi:tetratricopeptide (TPR) repeat protein